MVPRPADVHAAAPKAPALPRAVRVAAQGARGRRRAQPARAAGRHRAHCRAARRDLTGHPAIAIRTGDTPQAERARFQREPADILITTPESLYLLLTSNAREALRSIDTVIIDEIHALVPTKRGAHLALSLERLEAICQTAAAAHRPLGDAASARRSGAVSGGTQRVVSRQSSVVGRRSSPRDRSSRKKRDRGRSRDRANRRRVQRSPQRRALSTGHDRRRRARKALKLTIDVPVEDMARPGAADDIPNGPAGASEGRQSIWSAIHPRLLELIRAHRSTLIFVNSRRLAERLAGALNELAGETLVRSHHGSIARPQRVEIEDMLKAGALRALVATSSLELGIDMGAIDLVVQIEAPPTVASGLQRIGRGGHQANAVSEGVIFPKFRGDLVACAAVAKAMHDGDGRSDPLSPQSARHRRAADRRDGLDGSVGRRRSVRDHSPRGAVRRTEAHGVRRRARHALGPLPVRRVRRTAAAHHVGPRRGNDHRARGRQAGRDRPTAARFPIAGSTASSWPAPGRARRASASSTKRWCSKAHRRDVRARRLDVAHRGDHARSRARDRRRRASPARCRSGRAIAPGVRSSSGSRSDA